MNNTPLVWKPNGKGGYVVNIPIGDMSPEDVHNLITRLIKEYKGDIDFSGFVRRERRLKIDKIIGKINEK